MRTLGSLLAVPESSPAAGIQDTRALAAMRDAALQAGDWPLAKDANLQLAHVEVAAGATVYRHAPALLHLELSRACVCACIMCEHAYTGNADAAFLDVRAFRDLLPCARIAVVNGTGEAFLHPEIGSILELMCAYGVDVSATTNAQVLDPALLPLVARCFRRLAVSCDAADASAYEAIRRGARFALFQENTQRLVAACPDTRFLMAVVSMRQNLLQSCDLVELAARLGFHEVRFGRLEVNPLLDNLGDDLMRFPNLAARELQRARVCGAQLGLDVNIPRICEGPFDAREAERECAAIDEKPLFRPESFYRSLVDRCEAGEFGSCLSTAPPAPAAPASYAGTVPCSGLCHWLGYGAYLGATGEVRPCGEIVGAYGAPRGAASLPAAVPPAAEPTATSLSNTEAQVQLRRTFAEGLVPEPCLNCSYLLSNEYGSVQVDAGLLKGALSARAAERDQRPRAEHSI